MTVVLRLKLETELQYASILTVSPLFPAVLYLTSSARLSFMHLFCCSSYWFLKLFAMFRSSFNFFFKFVLFIFCSFLFFFLLFLCSLLFLFLLNFFVVFLFSLLVLFLSPSSSYPYKIMCVIKCLLPCSFTSHFSLGMSEL